MGVIGPASSTQPKSTSTDSPPASMSCSAVGPVRTQRSPASDSDGRVK